MLEISKRLTLLFVLLVACGPKKPIHPGSDTPQIRFRPAPEIQSPEAQWLLQNIPGTQWDKGLEEATRLLVKASRDRLGRITPRAAHSAQAIAGYPGHARFFKELTGGSLPEQLLVNLQRAVQQKNQPADIALTRRAFGDGSLLWIGAVAHRPVLLDPVDRHVPLDGRVPVGLEILDPDSSDPLARASKGVLFVTPPFGRVRTYPLNPERTRWIDGFNEPGTYQMEVVARGDRTTQVLLRWTHFVDIAPPNVSSLQRGSLDNPNPFEATKELYKALNELRESSGLQPVERFEPFESLARQHAALMASSGVVDHTIPGRTAGVASKAQKNFHPGARHYENLAAAPDWKEAMDMVTLSPGHLANLLCEDCSHASIGVALEPVIDRVPRLFVVWEMLNFPHGSPRPIQPR